MWKFLFGSDSVSVYTEWLSKRIKDRFGFEPAGSRSEHYQISATASAVNWFIPPSIEPGSLRRKRGEMLVKSAALLSGIALIGTTVIWALHGDPYPAVAAMIASIILVLLCPFLMRWTGKLELPASIFLTLCVIGMSTQGFLDAGIRDPGLIAMLQFPFMAALLLGRRASLLFAGFVCLVYLGYFTYQMNGGYIPFHTPERGHWWFQLMICGGVAISSGWIGFRHENMRKSLHVLRTSASTREKLMEHRLQQLELQAQEHYRLIESLCTSMRDEIGTAFAHLGLFHQNGSRLPDTDTSLNQVDAALRKMLGTINAASRLAAFGQGIDLNRASENPDDLLKDIQRLHPSPAETSPALWIDWRISSGPDDTLLVDRVLLLETLRNLLDFASSQYRSEDLTLRVALTTKGDSAFLHARLGVPKDEAHAPEWDTELEYRRALLRLLTDAQGATLSRTRNRSRHSETFDLLIPVVS